MAKSVHDDVLDGAFSVISSNVDRLCICSTAPTTYAEANSTYRLGYKDTPTFTGPANGDASGRKLTVDAVASGDGTIDATGTAEHVALVDTGNTKLLYVTSLSSSQSVTTGNTFSLTAWDIEIADPS